MLLTLWMLPFICRGVGIFLVAPSLTPVMMDSAGLVQPMTQKLLIAYISALALSASRLPMTVTSVSVSAVFCENYRMIKYMFHVYCIDELEGRKMLVGKFVRIKRPFQSIMRFRPNNHLWRVAELGGPPTRAGDSRARWGKMRGRDPPDIIII